MKTTLLGACDQFRNEMNVSGIELKVCSIILLILTSKKKFSDYVKFSITNVYQKYPF